MAERSYPSARSGAATESARLSRHRSGQRSYPTFEVRGGGQEELYVTGRSNLVLSDSLEGWDGVGGGREVQEGAYLLLIHVDVWQKPTRY